MKFWHLADLHIGKKLHGYSLHEEQKLVLKEIVDKAEQEKPDAIVIAGDIYDKSVPSAEAVTIFDEFLSELDEKMHGMPILLIAGNHDSPERLDYASSILQKQHIYIAGMPPSKKEENIRRVTLSDEFGEVTFFLLPFLRPEYVRNVFEGESIPSSYSEAIMRLIEREEIDYSQRNVLISHQFYTKEGNTVLRSDSETVSVGGIDNVDVEAVKAFDYVALGHIHREQKAGYEHIRYSGTPLKYSVSESGHEKGILCIGLREKQDGIIIEKIPLHMPRDVRKIEGMLEEIIQTFKGKKEEDFVSITLKDEKVPYKPKEQLEEIFQKLLEIRVDNETVRNRTKQENEEQEVISDEELFMSFYKEIHEKGLSESELRVLQDVIQTRREQI